MSLDYAERRIKEALRLTGGNVARARQQVMAWTFEDTKLLQALTQHHLSGIVAYHIERVHSGRSEKPEAPPPPVQKRAPANPDHGFGMEILKAVSHGGSSVFGLETYGAVRKKGQASAQHVDAIHKIAAKSKTKKPKTS